MNTFFKIFGFTFAVLFLVAAVLQYNDPDPLPQEPAGPSRQDLCWMLIWGLAAIISFLFARNKLSFTVPLLLGILGLIGFMYLYPSDFQGFNLNDGDIKTVELGREAFGLLIISVVMLVFAFRLKVTRKSKV